MPASLHAHMLARMPVRKQHARTFAYMLAHCILSLLSALYSPPPLQCLAVHSELQLLHKMRYCDLRRAQTENEPFDNLVAQRVISEEFGHTGPIAPNLPPLNGVSIGAKPLFAHLSADPIASASLGQVYRGATHEGVEVAVKVQRPDALRQCLLDGCVVIAVLSALQGKWGAGDLLEIFDTIAHGVVQVQMSCLSRGRIDPRLRGSCPRANLSQRRAVRG
eukprot:6214373-Pleurochrysis_carterae.AAC.12